VIKKTPKLNKVKTRIKCKEMKEKCGLEEDADRLSQKIWYLTIVHWETTLKISLRTMERQCYHSFKRILK